MRNKRIEQFRAHFDEAELVDLTLAIVAINGWNRLAVAFGSPPGTYQPKRGSAVSAEAESGRMISAAQTT